MRVSNLRDFLTATPQHLSLIGPTAFTTFIHIELAGGWFLIDLFQIVSTLLKPWPATSPFLFSFHSFLLAQCPFYWTTAFSNFFSKDRLLQTTLPTNGFISLLSMYNSLARYGTLGWQGFFLPFWTYYFTISHLSFCWWEFFCLMKIPLFL